MTTLIPVGIGVGAIAGLVARHRSMIIAVASAVIILLGLLQLAGRGFDMGRMVPGIARLQEQSLHRAGWVKTLILGAVSGVAGFCTGPILGAVLTMSASRGMSGAAVLLGIYALGMVVPLIAIATVWNRMGDHTRRLLRGRELRLGAVRIHTTNLISGLLLVAVGIAFWRTNGFISVPEPIDADTQLSLQDAVALLADPVIDIVAVVAIAAALLFWWWRRDLKHSTDSSAGENRSGE
ncbi:cytochrome c biogenesis CcdA family protein [Gordonia humi]|uniref:cytochrome c biogenesis CcdA family protein n=1 Tax=Gordonia humi TaxID=686429 RepID=UPI001FECE59C|nr:cytochrome c biogenesis protein CcdA [Gordonia humi]